MDCFGFVYLWFDTKHKKYIIGSHHGANTDSYTTSTGGKYVANIFKSRPGTLKRRILEYNTTVDDYRFTQQIEQKWLDLRPNIAENKRYYNKKQYATGGVDKTVKRTKPDHWKEWKSQHNKIRHQRGEHNFTSDFAKKNVIKRLAEKNHHFLSSDFNKKPFILIKNGVIIGTYDSKVHACEEYPAHLIDKLRKHGSWVAEKNPTQRYFGKWKKGDYFEYSHCT
jgi:hypothetical protein